jgi:hypothetical protein
MKKWKYENGYAGKIEYWSARLVEATRDRDREGIKKAAESLEYFVARQLNHLGSGPLTQVEWTFDFEEGGWNQVLATTAEEAFHQAVWDHPSLTPIRDSFRRASKEEVKSLLSLFH